MLSGVASFDFSSSLKSRRWRFVSALALVDEAVALIANRSLVKIVDLCAELIAKAAQSWLIRSRHCSQHLGRGRRKRVNKDELRVIAYGHVEQQHRQADQARLITTNCARGFGGQREHPGPISQAGFLQLSFIGFGQWLKIGRAARQSRPARFLQAAVLQLPRQQRAEIQASLRPTGSG